MDAEMARLFAKAICLLPMIATAPAEAALIGKAFEAIGRNPKLENTLFSKVIIGVALVESTAIYSLVAFFTI